MSMTNDEMLKDAAQRGDIDLLYTVIENDPEVLQNIDSKSFIQTPLHTAAFEGHVKFATEIMRLKPSFAWKLNQQGYSPIHLAMENDKMMMVRHFVDMDTNLVRVKGRKGLTPLHLASRTGQIKLLDIFLDACPDSIEDVTVSRETALHIAVKNEQFEALQLMVGWLKTTQHRGSIGLERIILNWKDEAGNTILHDAACGKNNSRAVGLLVKTKMDLSAKNLGNATALDVAVNDDIKIILFNAARIKHGSLMTHAHSFLDVLGSGIILIVDKLAVWTIWIIRLQNETTEEQRQVFLVIATLVATATYQSILSPAGGVFQANAGDNTSNMNMTTSSSNSTATHSQRLIVGQSVMGDFFVAYSFVNTLTYFLSILSILILSPRGSVGILVALPVMLFTYGYACTMLMISPSPIVSRMVLLFCVLAIIYYWIVVVVGKFGSHDRKIRPRKRPRGNIW